MGRKMAGYVSTEAFRAACARAGIRVTPQRVEIYRALAQRRRHPDAETLHGWVAQRMPGVSLDTVYRTLALFEHHGLVSRVATPNARSRYDAGITPHAHFICTECERVIDVAPPPVTEETDVDVPRDELGRIRSVQTVLLGVCRNCLDRARMEKSRSALATGT